MLEGANKNGPSPLEAGRFLWDISQGLGWGKRLVPQSALRSTYQLHACLTSSYVVPIFRPEI